MPTAIIITGKKIKRVQYSGQTSFRILTWCRSKFEIFHTVARKLVNDITRRNPDSFFIVGQLVDKLEKTEKAAGTRDQSGQNLCCRLFALTRQCG